VLGVALGELSGKQGTSVTSTSWLAGWRDLERVPRIGLLSRETRNEPEVKGATDFRNCDHLQV